MCLIEGFLSAQCSGSRCLLTVDRAEISEREALSEWKAWVSWALGTGS